MTKNRKKMSEEKVNKKNHFIFLRKRFTDAFFSLNSRSVFLVADMQLYERLYPSVDPLVRWSVGPLVRWSAGPLVCWPVGPLVRWSVGSSITHALKTAGSPSWPMNLVLL